MNGCGHEECVCVKCLTGHDRLGYLVNMTRCMTGATAATDSESAATAARAPPRHTFAYSEHVKYVQRPGKTHMAAAE